MDQNDTPPRPVPAGWLETLERSRADVAAGRVIPGEVVMRRLHETIARMNAEQAAHDDATVPHR